MQFPGFVPLVIAHQGDASLVNNLTPIIVLKPTISCIACTYANSSHVQLSVCLHDIELSPSLRISLLMRKGSESCLRFQSHPVPYSSWM